MKKIYFYVIYLLLLGLLLMFSTVLITASEPKYGGTLKVAVPAFPVDYDPPVCRSTSSNIVTQQVFEGLFVVDNNSEIVPHLVESWNVSEDGKIFTFYLRKGIKFHNGKEMTEEDVIASINRAKSVSFNVTGLSVIENIYAKDKYTVVVELQEPTVTFMIRISDKLQTVAIMPKEIIDGVPGGELNTVDKLIGTGPFKYEEIVPDQYIKLKRFEEYKPLKDVPPSGRAGSKIAYVDDVFVYPVSEVMTRLAGLQTGEYDIVQKIDTDLYATSKEDPNIKVEIVKPGLSLLVMFNTRQGIMTDQKLRRAIQYAINCDEILMAAKGDKTFYETQGTVFTENQKWYSDVGIEHYNIGDIEGSSKIVEDLGYKGQVVRIVTTREYVEFYNAAIVLRDQLKEIGLEPEINVVDWPTNVEKFSKDYSDWEITFNSFSERIDPIGYMHNFDGSFLPYKSEEMDKLLEKIVTSVDFETRYELSKEFQNLVMNDIPLIFIGRFYNLDAARKNVYGYTTIGDIPVFWNVWKE